jgi:glycosyltransferase 2 family protein
MHKGGRIARIVPPTVAFLLIGWIASRVDWQAAGMVLSNANKAYFLAALALMYLQFAVSTAKWRQLLANRGLRLSFFQLYRIYMSGAFISSFLPSRYSGDVYRGWIVSRKTGQTYDAAASVILERVTGLFVLCSIGLVTSVWWTLSTEHDFLLPVALAMAGLVAGLCALFSKRTADLTIRILRFFGLDFAVRPVNKMHAAINAYRRQKGLAVRVMGLSLVFYLQSFLILYLLLQSVGGAVPYTYMAVVTPIVYLLEALPISVNGLGVREGAFFVLLGRIGITPETIVAFSILVLLNRTLSNLTGGLFLGFRRSDWSAAAQPPAAMKEAV